MIEPVVPWSQPGKPSPLASTVAPLCSCSACAENASETTGWTDAALFVLACVLLFFYIAWDEFATFFARLTFGHVDRVLTTAGKWLLLLAAFYLACIIFGAYYSGAFDRVGR